MKTKALDLSSPVLNISIKETKEFYETKIKSLKALSYSNYLELLISLLKEEISLNLINNIYHCALSSQKLDIKKDKKNRFEIEFKSSGDKIFQKINKKFDAKIILEILDRFEINQKNNGDLFSLIKDGTVVFKKAMSELCFLIILSSIQNTFSFNKIKRYLFDGMCVYCLKDLRFDYFIFSSYFIIFRHFQKNSIC